MLFLTEWNSHHERAAQVVKRDALLAAHKAQRGAQRAALARERDERVHPGPDADQVDGQALDAGLGIALRGNRRRARSRRCRRAAPTRPAPPPPRPQLRFL